MSAVILNISGPIATITLNRPDSYNALTPQDYDDLGEGLRTIDKRDDVLVTILQANGKYFCAGTNVATPRKSDIKTTREYFLSGLARSNTDVTHALYTHKKILVAALNGPAIGIGAAYLGQFDFVYALPGAWITVPFAYLGLALEAGISVTFVEKRAPLANEVLIFGKKLTIEDLERTGFVNKVFPGQDVPSFHESVRAHLLSQLEGLDAQSILKIKSLIKAAKSEKNAPEAANLRESYAQAELMEGGTPKKRFAMFARKEIRHKL